MYKQHLFILWLTAVGVLPLQVFGQHNGGGRGGDQIQHISLGAGEKLEAAFSLLPPAERQVVGSHRLSGRSQQNLLRRGNWALTMCRILRLGLVLLKSFPSYPPLPPKVMAIWPSFFAWQRERSEKHSGAQRRYGEKMFSLPRSRTASQVPCSLCDRTSTASQPSGPSLDPRISPEVSTHLLAVELTPLSNEAHKMQPRRSVSCCSVKDFQVSSRYWQVFSRILNRGGGYLNPNT